MWQESFTNHRVRDEQDYARYAEYIRMNPVRARLSDSPEVYPYSSETRRREAICGGEQDVANVEERPFMAALRVFDFNHEL